MPPLQIDFVRRAPMASALGWLLLAVGVAGFAVVLADSLDAHAQRQEAQAQLDRQGRAQRPAAPRRAVPVVVPELQRATDRAGVALQRPWGELLQALESQAEDSPVALLALQGNGEEGNLRLTGEARSMKDIAAYLERLREQPLLRSVVLASHEQRVEAGVSLLRFTLDARWRPDAAGTGGAP